MSSLSFDPQEVTAAILAGGEGRRMDGRDKGLVEIAGKPLIAHVVAALRGQASRLLICANRNAAEYAAFAEVAADAAAGYRGPLAGIATALARCATTWLLTVPVDAPQPPHDLALQLWSAAARSGAEAAVAFEGVRPQPMFALYRSRLAESAATALASDLPVWRWQQQIGAVEVFFDDGIGLFANLNNADDVSAWEQSHADTEREFPVGLSLEAARAHIERVAASHLLPVETVAIETALGRVLAVDVRAPFDVPAFANSAMDGYAVQGADLSAAETRLRVIGTALAGGGPSPAVASGTCVRITTGAVLPRGADTVVIKESTTLDGDFVRIATAAQLGANVRPAGEDYRNGDLALRRGAVLTPARIGALASFGMTEVAVVRRPRVVLLTTGDELVAPGQLLAAGQIHDSNRHTLGALLEQHACELVRHERLRDDPARLRDALARADVDADIVITSGGVSAGEADFMPGLLAQIGEVHFWKVRIKPGMPFLFGAIAGALVFGLPGNPVSGIATFLALVKPALTRMSGRSEPELTLRARLANPVLKRHTRVELLRAWLSCDDTGALSATPLPKQGSGMLAGVADANALILIPEPAQEYPAGTPVEVLPLPGAFA